MNTTIWLKLFYDIAISFKNEVVSYCLNLGTSSTIAIVSFMAIFAIAIALKFKDKISCLITHVTNFQARRRDIFVWATTNNTDSLLKSVSLARILNINFKFFIVVISFQLIGHLPDFVVIPTFGLDIAVSALLYMVSDIKNILYSVCIYPAMLLTVYLTAILRSTTETNLFNSYGSSFLELYNIDFQQQTFFDAANQIVMKSLPWCLLLCLLVVTVFLTLRVIIIFSMDNSLKILALATSDKHQ